MQVWSKQVQSQFWAHYLVRRAQFWLSCAQKILFAYTDLPAYSDTVYSDTPLTVTLFTGSGSHLTFFVAEEIG